MDHPLRIAAFISGGGSNLQAILDAIEHGALQARVVLVVSSRADAGGLARAERAGIPTLVLPPVIDTAELLRILEAHRTNFVALAGFMRMIPPELVRAFHGRMTNIHPALLPAFGGKGMYGKRVHEAVLAYGARWTGVTVHLVDEEYDSGPVVLQDPVPVEQDDTPETLAARVLLTEHTLYPAALQLFAEGRIRLEGRRVRILPIESPTAPDRS